MRRAEELEALLEGAVRGGGGRGPLVALAPGAVLAGVLDSGRDSRRRGRRTPVLALDAGQGFAHLAYRSYTGVRPGYTSGIQATWRELWVFGELYGCAQRALEQSVAYAGDREQFGRPIVSYQAVSHRLARMAVELEALDAGMGRLAARWDERLAAVLRYAGPAAARRVIESAIQVHGGMGFTWELGCTCTTAGCSTCRRRSAARRRRSGRCARRLTRS